MPLVGGRTSGSPFAARSAPVTWPGTTGNGRTVTAASRGDQPPGRSLARTGAGSRWRWVLRRCPRPTTGRVRCQATSRSPTTVSFTCPTPWVSRTTDCPWKRTATQSSHKRAKPLPQTTYLRPRRVTLPTFPLQPQRWHTPLRCLRTIPLSRTFPFRPGGVGPLETSYALIAIFRQPGELWESRGFASHPFGRFALIDC